MTCQECHGVLVKICDGSIERYRCHTGHAYSLQTLLADVNEQIDASLWSSLRAMEERILLLLELKAAARSNEDTAKEERYAEEARRTGERSGVIRQLLVEHTPPGSPSDGGGLTRAGSPGDPNAREEERG
jgi:two-component system chemotaxis response regulator CheB